MPSKAPRSGSRTQEEWNVHKAAIYQKYIVENATLDELVQYLAEERTFKVRQAISLMGDRMCDRLTSCSAHQLSSQFNTWGKDFYKKDSYIRKENTVSAQRKGADLVKAIASAKHSSTLIAAEATSSYAVSEPITNAGLNIAVPTSKSSQLSKPDAGSETQPKPQGSAHFASPSLELQNANLLVNSTKPLDNTQKQALRPQNSSNTIALPTIAWQSVKLLLPKVSKTL